MEAKKSTFTQRTPEEIRAWFNRAKARIAAREAEAMAMYEEELRMKAVDHGVGSSDHFSN